MTKEKVNGILFYQRACVGSNPAPVAKRILFIAFMLLMGLTVCSQQLYLGCSKTTVQYDMHSYKGFDLTVRAKDYLEYQKDSIAVAFRFEDKVCVMAMITMPVKDAERFIASKVKVWEPCQEGWLYDTQVFDTPVLVRKFDQGLVVTFEYTFKEK